MNQENEIYIWVSVWWKARPTYECRCDERLNEIWKIYVSRIHWVTRGTGTPKDRDEVNRWDVCKCDGWVCVLEVIDTLSILRKSNDDERRKLVVYYESIKRNLKRRRIYEYRCDERLKTKNEESTRLADTGLAVKPVATRFVQSAVPAVEGSKKESFACDRARTDDLRINSPSL